MRVQGLTASFEINRATLSSFSAKYLVGFEFRPPRASFLVHRGELLFPCFSLGSIRRGTICASRSGSYHDRNVAIPWEKEETARGLRVGKRGITVRPVHGRNNVIAPCEYGFYEDDDSIRLLSGYPSGRLPAETIIPRGSPGLGANSPRKIRWDILRLARGFLAHS